MSKKFYVVLFFILASVVLAQSIDYSKYDISKLTQEERGNYVIGSLDETDITPKTWLGIQLILYKHNGTHSSISLLRPLWWFEENKPQIGETMYLSLPEMNLYGEAYILSIKSCNIDSRDVPEGQSVVIGKFAHESAEVLNLIFQNEDGKQETLGVTKTHPLFSIDRSTWIEAGYLEKNEHVRTKDGKKVWLIGKSVREGKHKVYNLEVHRTHTFFVSKFGILAHNTCAVFENKLGISVGSNQDDISFKDTQGNKVKRKDAFTLFRKKLQFNNPNKGNIAVAKVMFTDGSSMRFLATSDRDHRQREELGCLPPPAKRRLTTFQVVNPSGSTRSAANDSEVKIYNEILSFYEKNSAKVIKKVHLISENEPCTSCERAGRQFLAKISDDKRHSDAEVNFEKYEYRHKGGKFLFIEFLKDRPAKQRNGPAEGIVK